MCYYRFACALLMVVASSVSCDNRNPPSTISLHQSASASDESFTPLSGYDGGGGDGGSLFPADVPGVEQVFAPTLPIPEKQVLELAGLRADIAATSSSGRGSGRPDVDEHHPAAQKIYPTFFRNIPPLGHSRPYYQSTEAAIEQRYNKLRAPALPEVATSPLLGSGDFGVIKGGTFYYDTDAPSKGFADDFYGLGYNGNNGHGRPQLAFLVQKPHQKEEQFSNFRDFADINISNDPAYSHHAPLYVPADAQDSTGSTRSGARHEPENILDELRSLDRETTTTAASTTSARSTQGKGRGKAKKSTLVERKKRPKSVAGAAKPDAADDYMLASS
uniref:Secreted protein n=1 Tax=Anopheles atroparvus TaxID=41427 RepID=A0AAG5DIS3_ANOAO